MSGWIQATMQQNTIHKVAMASSKTPDLIDLTKKNKDRTGSVEKNKKMKQMRLPFKKISAEEYKINLQESLEKAKTTIDDSKKGKISTDSIDEEADAGTKIPDNSEAKIGSARKKAALEVSKNEINPKSNELEKMPDEIILRILSFLDIKGVLKCGQVSTRIRGISNDESLWLKLNFYGGDVPYGFIEKAVENGCKYLSLAHACLYGGENSKLPLNLKYLEMFHLEELNEPYTTKIYCKGLLLKNCHSLEKLSIFRASEYIENICKNGQTLKVLSLMFYNVHLWNNGNPTKAIQKLFKSCVELDELNVQDLFALGRHGSKLLTAMVQNITSKILKVNISNNKNIKDEHVKILVVRCNKITELNLSYTSITKDSVDSIATHLNLSLEKLDVSYTNITSTSLLQLKSVGTIKVLRFFKNKENIKELKDLRKNLPQLSINEEQFYIATSNTNSPFYENGFWEIKAKAQKLFQRSEFESESEMISNQNSSVD